ncbi:DUF992 domain-containing protein [Mesorhizobium sp. NBSH29]|uniref:DUF992 domain-containing protein n=1 Tax=Mesorhizobium sp. NBSH29 TaxID=2654249 RepID=UPI0018963F17|nr:DUF992 domain-containing protein [Mesorhizobium sp. NBSH29]QPC85518.1 DUF992 domain-containing protein [Mesorhizobium sp. NBSH29]
MKTIALASATALLLLASPTFAAEGVELGVLDCAIEPGTGFIIGSKKELSCTFNSAEKTFAAETYVGDVTKFGLDIGTTGTTMMQWLVVAPSPEIYAPGVLAGDYVGASAEATAVVGAGANVLIGGSSKSFTLQPVSVQAQTGLNLAVGVTQFRLRSVGN